MNTSPALFRAGKYLAELLPRVIEEVVQKTVDVALPPPAGTEIDLLDGFELLSRLSAETESTLTDSFGKLNNDRAPEGIRHTASGRWKP